MAKKKNYTERLTKLKARRSDSILNESFTTRSFTDTSVPETIKYVFESMEPIENAYTKKTYDEATRVQNQIAKRVGDINISFEYQGSVPLNTHIKLHSDLDILVFNNHFFSLEPPLKPSSPYTGNPTSELSILRDKVYMELKAAYPTATVNNSKGKAISIEGGSLARKFDIIICNWHHTSEYHYSKDSKGIMLFDKTTNQRVKDFPFHHMAQVEAKDRQLVISNYKRVIRLLKSLKMDAAPVIDISSFMITSTMYHMRNEDYLVPKENTFRLLSNTSQHLDRVIQDEGFRRSLWSPNQTEKLYTEDENKKVQALRRLKVELDETIEDLVQDLSRVRMFSSAPNLGMSPLYEALNKNEWRY